MDIGDTLYNVYQVINPQWARQYQAAKQSKMQTEGMEANKPIADMERNRVKGAQFAQQMQIAALTNDPQMFAKAYSGASQLINDGEGFHGMVADSTTNTPVFRAVDYRTGSNIDVPANNKSMLAIAQKTYNMFRTPDDYFKTYTDNAVKNRDFNREAAASPVKLADGKSMGWKELDDDGKLWFVSRDQAGNTKRSDQPFDTWDMSQKVASDTLKNKKEKADIEKTVAETATEKERPGLVKAQTNSANASAYASTESGKSQKAYREHLGALTDKIKAEIDNASGVDKKDVQTVMEDLDKSIYRIYTDNESKTTKKDFIPLDDTQLETKRRNALMRGLDIVVDVDQFSDGSQGVRGYRVVPAQKINTDSELPKPKINVVLTPTAAKAAKTAAAKTPKQLTQSMAKKYYDQAKGNSKKAAELAKKDGYTF